MHLTGPTPNATKRTRRVLFDSSPGTFCTERTDYIYSLFTKTSTPSAHRRRHRFSGELTRCGAPRALCTPAIWLISGNVRLNEWTGGDRWGSGTLAEYSNGSVSSTYCTRHVSDMIGRARVRSHGRGYHTHGEQNLRNDDDDDDELSGRTRRTRSDIGRTRRTDCVRTGSRRTAVGGGGGFPLPRARARPPCTMETLRRRRRRRRTSVTTTRPSATHRRRTPVETCAPVTRFAGAVRYRLSTRLGKRLRGTLPPLGRVRRFFNVLSLDRRTPGTDVFHDVSYEST